MALAALEIHAHEKPARVARETGIIRVLLPDLVQPARHEPARAAQLLVLEIRAENLARHLIPRLVRAERFSQVAAPFVVAAVALHELDVERLGHLLGEARRGDELFNQLGAFVSSLVGEKLLRLLRAGNAAVEVEPRAPKKLRVVRRCGERLFDGLRFRGDEGVHLPMQRLGGKRAMAGHQRGQ